MTIASAAILTGTAPAPLSLKRGNGHRPRLLLAEDSDPVRIVTAAMLKSMGCDVSAVVHGEEAVNSASANSYDVIVLDIEMPIMDGITAARSIRRLGGTISSTPIMALSAFLADAMQSASWSDTFDIALPKPANKNELHAAVQAALDWQPRSGVQHDREHLPLLCETEFAIIRSGMSAAVLHELLTVACRDIEVCALQLRSAAAAGSGAEQIYARKLLALGQTFAATRLVAAAKDFVSTGSAGSMTALVVAAEATCDALRQP